MNFGKFQEIFEMGTKWFVQSQIAMNIGNSKGDNTLKLVWNKNFFQMDYTIPMMCLYINIYHFSKENFIFIFCPMWVSIAPWNIKQS